VSNLHEELRTEIERVLVPLLESRAQRICIVDPPDHPNVGDNAIFLGELDFIRRRFPEAGVTFFDRSNYTDGCDRFIASSSLLLFHGGGNFGEIWPIHHSFRLHILNRFPHLPTIQLPQSISFVHPQAIAETARAIDKRADFKLLLRDETSLQFARRHFSCESLLCPDMAFSMEPIRRLPPSVEYLGLLRTDKEVRANHADVIRALKQASTSVEVADWLQPPRSIVSRLDRKLSRAWAKWSGLAGVSQSLALALRERYARDRLSFGTSLLSRGACVVTDRLHAHILSCLLEIENFVFDSLDGKISAFHKAWTSRVSGARIMSSVEQFAAIIANRS
jgi:pyruvyl transferase EpsO